MADERSNDPRKHSAANAVDKASSKTPLDSDEHIDPSQARASVENAQQRAKSTSKSDGGSAPIEARPNHVREKTHQDEKPIGENLKSESAHEGAKEELRQRRDDSEQ